MFTSQPSAQSRRKGFTLTEMAIVLGVIGAMLGGIWAASAAAYNSMKLSQAQKDLLTLVQNVRSLYAARGSFPYQPADIDYTLAFANASVIPADMIVPGGVNPVVDAWGDRVTVTTQSNYGGSLKATNRFEITFWGMSQASCYPFITQTVNSAAASNGLTFIGNDAVGSYGDGTGSLGPITSVTEATFQNCSQNTILQYSM